LLFQLVQVTEGGESAAMAATGLDSNVQPASRRSDQFATNCRNAS
jgi:hypothetical protein